jgi:glycosyltransferase involved in cell wall biosynthesis
MLPCVSVVIPTWNRAEWVRDAIDSVLAQDYPRLEVVVVDDGSTDATPEVVRRYGSQVRYIRQANGGAASARNRGIAEATGEFVAFLDSDDLFLPGKLTEQVREFGRQPGLVMVYAWFSILDGSGRERLGRRFHRTGDIARSLLAHCMQGPLATPTVMVRRTALLQAGGFDETMRLSEDTDLWCRVARLGRVGLVPRVLVQVRRHEGNLSRGPGRARFLAASLRILDKAFAADPTLPRLWKARVRAKAHLWSWIVGTAGLLPSGLSFWLRALWTNPRATVGRWLARFG